MTPETIRPRRRSRGLWLLGVAAIAVAALCVVAMVLEHYANQDQLELTTTRRPPPVAQLAAVRPRSFTGPVSALRRTLVVPTLDTPLPLGHNAIWAATLDLAWRQLMIAGGGAVELRGAEDLCHVLNQSASRPTDLDAEDFVAAAGPATDEVLDRLGLQMRERFLGEPVPDLQVARTALFAFAFLRINLDLKEPLTQIKDEVAFHCGDGGGVKVWAFGTGPRQAMPAEQVSQAVALFRQHGAFAVDLTGGEEGGYELILARMSRSASLAQSYAELERLMAWGKYQGGFPQPLGGAARLIVPEMAWRVMDELTGLQDREVAAPAPWAGRRLERLRHTVELRLDHAGALVRARAEFPTNGNEMVGDNNEYLFNRPFLIVLRKRGLSRPFLVAWIDNDELLMRR